MLGVVSDYRGTQILTTNILHVAATYLASMRDLAKLETAFLTMMIQSTRALEGSRYLGSPRALSLQDQM